MNALQWLLDLQREVFPTKRQKEKQFYESGRQTVQAYWKQGLPDDVIRDQLSRCYGGNFASAFKRGMIEELENGR